MPQMAHFDTRGNSVYAGCDYGKGYSV